MKKTSKSRLPFVILILLATVLGIRSSVFEPFYIPSSSMFPELIAGDTVFVNKLSYGLKVPLSEYLLEEPMWVTHFKNPQRGDVIVFMNPREEEGATHIIKRVVGLPGDKIQLKDKKLIINGKEVFREKLEGMRLKPFLETAGVDPRAKYNHRHLEYFEESFSEHDHHWTVANPKLKAQRNFGPFEVPTGKVFVLGDQRDDSKDSRHFGAIGMERILGRAARIGLSAYWNFGERLFFFRANRIGKKL